MGKNSANKVNINLLIQQVRTSSKFLHRDYLELEILQTSTKNLDLFVAKAKARLAENLQKSLSKYFETIVFDHDSVNLNSSLPGNLVLIQVLDGINNFKRAIPFFAVIVTIASFHEGKLIAEKIIINFPALGSIYYAEKNKGAWMEKHEANFNSGTYRLRASMINKLEEALITCDYSEIHLATKISSNIRIFESLAYQIALIISGKADCSILPAQKMLIPGFELLVREAGGTCYIKDNMFIVSNFQLQEKLKAISLQPD